MQTDGREKSQNVEDRRNEGQDIFRDVTRFVSGEISAFNTGVDFILRDAGLRTATPLGGKAVPTFETGSGSTILEYDGAYTRNFVGSLSAPAPLQLPELGYTSNQFNSSSSSSSSIRGNQSPSVSFVEVISAKGTTTVVRGSDGEIYTLQGGAGGVGSRNNNPGALKYGPRAERFGAIGQTAAPPGSPDGLGYAIFPSYTAGVQAYADLQQQRHANSTIAQMVKSYAVDEALPAYKNYAADLAKAAGVTVNTKISDLTPAQFARLQAKQFEVEGAGTGKLRVTNSKGEVVDVNKVFGPRMVPHGNVPAVATQTSTTRSGSADVASYQAQLKAAGFDPGAVDGIKGKNTTAAVKAFQTANGLTVDGIVGPETLRALAGIASGPTPAPRLSRDGTVLASNTDPSKGGRTYTPIAATIGGVQIAVRSTGQSMKNETAIRNAIAPDPAGHDQMLAARSTKYQNVLPGMIAPQPAGIDERLAARTKVPRSAVEREIAGFGTLFQSVLAGQKALQSITGGLPSRNETEGLFGPTGPTTRGRPKYGGDQVAPVPVFGRPQTAPVPATRSSMIAPNPATRSSTTSPSTPANGSGGNSRSPGASSNNAVGTTAVGTNGYVYTNTSNGWVQSGTTRPQGMTPAQQYAAAAASAHAPTNAYERNQYNAGNYSDGPSDSLVSTSYW